MKCGVGVSETPGAHREAADRKTATDTPEFSP